MEDKTFWKVSFILLAVILSISYLTPNIINLSAKENTIFACPSTNNLQSTGNGESNPVFLQKFDESTLDLNGNQLEPEKVALNARDTCLWLMDDPNNFQGVLQAMTESANEAINECMQVPYYKCDTGCYPSSTMPSCTSTSTAVAKVDLLNYDIKTNTATFKCSAIGVSRANGNYQYFCTEE